MQKAAPVDMWRKQIGPMLEALGKLESFGATVSQPAGANTVVVLSAKFEKQALWAEWLETSGVDCLSGHESFDLIGFLCLGLVP